jgi:hypothetical protein
MNISLRKANAIQNIINELLKSINVVENVSLNEFEVAEQVIAIKADESFKAFQRQLALVDALYDIRSNVASANNATGITEMLTKIARLDKLIAINQKMADRPVRQNAEVIEGKLNKLRNSKDEGRSLIYDRYNEISTGVATEASNQSYKEALAAHKREKQRLQDAVLEANVRNEIIIDAMTVATLRTEGLI